MVQEYTILNLPSRQTFHGIFKLLIIKRLTQYGSGIYNIKSFFKINVSWYFRIINY